VAKESKNAAASFKQYRDKDGLFYFKLVDPKGEVLLQSLGFASPKEAGQTIARLQQEGVNALAELKQVLIAPNAEQRLKIDYFLRIL
jgi:tryptophanyl-tRNA synthetase